MPGLATVLVGDDPASAVYVANKRRACAEAGIADLHRHLPATATAAEVTELLLHLNEDPACSGILLQRPLPDGLDDAALSALIAPDKDVDGLTPISAGRLLQGAPGLRPCTPLGVIELLDRHDVPLEGAEASIVGRSDLVGKPVAHLLLQRNATVTICHSRTRDLPAVCARADVLIAAVGVPRLLGRRRRQAGRRRDRRRHEPAARGAVRRRRLRRRARGRRAAHAGPRGRRPDDDRDAAAQHGSRRKTAIFAITAEPGVTVAPPALAGT